LILDKLSIYWYRGTNHTYILLSSLEGVGKGLNMKKMRGFGGSKFLILICFTFFLTTIGFPGVTTQAKDAKFPIGEMISKGEVRFEAREKAWKNIDSSHFPVFEKGKIKTEQGTGMVTLGNNCHLEIAQNSVISFEQVDRMHLTQGRVNFRIPSGSEMTIEVGSLAVIKPRVQQATKDAAIVPAKGIDTVGSIALHSNGSVTIRNLQGSLTILDQDRVVLAALGTKESITIPSFTASGKLRTRVAQAGEVKEEENRDRKRAGASWWDTGEWEYLRLNAMEWIAVGYAAALVGAFIYAFWPEDDKDRTVEEQVPICP
jgi:hypothetical protein